ncbi:MAG TPA: helix-turn-helix transcriptional regulator [Pyrinomonadaceae bacterium]|jgi:transcriptional regulator with XRE-family HTH domain
MGRTARPKPERLAAKLYAIRSRLDITQGELIKRLGYRKSPLYPSSISEFEQGKREPPLLVLSAYAKLVGVPMEMLVDDDQDLPENLPSQTGYEWVMKRVKTRQYQR